jgi:phenylalanyl-tRNA synthetase beta chain
MGAVFTDKKAGFEMVHGLLDRVMQTLSVPFLQSSDSKGEYGYYISQSDGMSPFQVS